jgi:photosystem II stability/assembly factor-like uncharacterized protein
MTYGLNGVHFENSATGWIAGSHIHHTADGGSTWELQHEGAANDVTFVDDQSGWAVGPAGMILHTSNGGRVWEPQTSGTIADLHAVAFPSARTGYVAGANGTILYTSDGGMSWIPQWTGTHLTLVTLDFLNERIGWAGGYFGNLGAIYHTSDGGENWLPQHNAIVYDVDFVNERRGWAATLSGMLATEDGGETWRKVDALGSPVLFTVAFADKQVGVAAGDLGFVYATTDGGTSWTTQPIRKVEQRPLTDAFIIPPSTAVVVGSSGTILRTDTGFHVPVSIVESPDAPAPFVHANYPNPFRSATNIRFALPRAEHVVLRVYDLMGREVDRLLDRPLAPGLHEVTWSGEGFAAGVYLYSLLLGERKLSGKMVLSP